LVQKTLVGISEASNILGVSEAALRQWTDEGKIKSFVTPGGHRRYSKADLKKFMGTQSKTLGIKDLVIELEETNEQLREIGHETLKRATWYGKLSDEEKKYLADLGRRLLNLIIKYLAEPSHREETMQLVNEIGGDLGKTLAKLSLPLTDSVEIFISHRDPIMNATTHLMKRREALTGRVVEAIPIVANVMDGALVALVTAHQQYRNEIHITIEEGWTK
jgi:excisionase family DNA binding protein